MPIQQYIFLTLFPEQVDTFLQYSILGKAQIAKKIEISTITIRKDHNEQIDDYAFGSGGMVLMAPPIIHRLRENNLLDEHIVLLTPRGQRFDQKKAVELSKLNKKLVFICGHYEGVDERVVDYVSEEISVGDFVLTSGELAALIVVDSVARLLPGVIKSKSLETESFDNNLLDHPCYTRPASFEHQNVPEILLSGDHEKIRQYRLSERLRLTKKYRPDLYALYKNKK